MINKMTVSRLILAAGEKTSMSEALTNTVLGIVIVFLALIFISIVISLFRFISVFEKKVAAKKEEGKIASTGVEQVISQIEEQEDAENDAALIAVITAAIYEYENACGQMIPGDLVVRSIRRHSSVKWQRA